MTETKKYPSWRELVSFTGGGPSHTELAATEDYKAVLVGLPAGKQIPPHPAATAAYHVLEGSGSIEVDGESIDLEPGATVTVPEGKSRGLVATTNLAVLASHGAPPGASGMKMPFKRMGLVGAGSMAAMMVLMVLIGRMLGKLSPMSAMMFPDGGDLGLGVWGMMIVPLAGMGLMFGMMFFFFRNIKRGKANSAHSAHHH